MLFKTSCLLVFSFLSILNFCLTHPFKYHKLSIKRMAMGWVELYPNPTCFRKSHPYCTRIHRVLKINTHTHTHTYTHSHQVLWFCEFYSGITTTTPSVIPLTQSLGRFKCEQFYPCKRLIPRDPQKI